MIFKFRNINMTLVLPANLKEAKSFYLVSTGQIIRNTIWIASYFLLAANFLQAAWSVPDKTVWQINYQCLMPPKCTVLIGSDAIKIVDAGGIELLAKAPQWDAYILNPKGKIMCLVPYKTWRARGSFMHACDAASTTPKDLVDKSATLLGLPVNHYAVKEKKIDGFWRTRNQTKECTGQFYGTNAIPMPDAERDIFIAWLGLPKTKEFPLFYGRTFAGDAGTYFLKVTHIAKLKSKGPIAVVPSDYKTSTMAEIFQGDSRDIYEALADFGSNPTSATDKTPGNDKAPINGKSHK